MDKKKLVLTYIAIVVAMACFGISFVWFKVANVSYGPLTIVFFRLLVSTTLLFPIIKLSKRLVIPDKKDLKYLLLLAFFEPFLYFMGESYGLQYMSSTVGAILIATIPLFTPLATYIFYKEKFSYRLLVGILISFLGVTMVIYEVGTGLVATPLGIVLQFIAVLAAVGYSIVLYKVSPRMNNLSIILFQNIIGAAYFLPFWLVFESKRFISTSFNSDAFMAIIFLAIFASTVAFIFYTYSIRQIGINKTSMFANTIPVFTAIFAFFVLGDRLNFQKVIGIVVVITGLFFAQVKIKKRYKGHEPIPRT